MTFLAQKENQQSETRWEINKYTLSTSTIIKRLISSQVLLIKCIRLFSHQDVWQFGVLEHKHRCLHHAGWRTWKGHQPWPQRSNCCCLAICEGLQYKAIFKQFENHCSTVRWLIYNGKNFFQGLGFWPNTVSLKKEPVKQVKN